MLTAETKNGRVAAWKAQKNDGPFWCPGCRWGAILKQGAFVVAHFAHEPGADCPYESYHQGESDLHLRSKQEVFTALQKCKGVTDLKLERYLGPVRPDVSFRWNGVPFAIEMQVSRINEVVIARRTREYSRRGIYLLWVSPWSEVEGLEHGSLYLNSHAWERYIHYVLYHGRFYYWVRGLTVRPVHFDEEYSLPSTDPLKRIKYAALRPFIAPDRQITDLEPFSVSVQYSEREPLSREAKLLGIPSVWVEQRSCFLSVQEAAKQYPREFFDPAQLVLPANVQPFEGDPFDDSKPAEPSDFLELAPGTSEKCPVHNRLYRHLDHFGTLYCSDPVCWSRYRLLSLGTTLEYPEVFAVYDPRDYLPDLSAEPTYKPAPTSDHHLIAVYPSLPPKRRKIIEAGEEAWKEFSANQPYIRIAMALRALENVEEQ